MGCNTSSTDLNHSTAAAAAAADVRGPHPPSRHAVTAQHAAKHIADQPGKYNARSALTM